MSSRAGRGGIRPHALDLPIMGVPFSFLTSSPELLALVEEAYARWRSPAVAGADPKTATTTATATVRLELAADVERLEVPPRFRHRFPEPGRMRIDGPGATGEADLGRFQAFGSVAPALLAHPAELLDGLIEPLTLFLLGGLDRQPLHAAAVARGGVAILLEGSSGAGKSTLAYTARRFGFAPLGDEAVYVQLRPELHVWSRRARIHLRTEARAFFPELERAAETTLPGGKRRIVIPEPRGVPRHARRVGICLLRRGPEPALERVAPARVADEMAARLEPGFDLYAATLRERALAVAAGGAWSLAAGPDPVAGAALLERVVGELSEHA